MLPTVTVVLSLLIVVTLFARLGVDDRSGLVRDSLEDRLILNVPSNPIIDLQQKVEREETSLSNNRRMTQLLDTVLWNQSRGIQEPVTSHLNDL